MNERLKMKKTNGKVIKGNSDVDTDQNGQYIRRNDKRLKIENRQITTQNKRLFILES